MIRPKKHVCNGWAIQTVDISKRYIKPNHWSLYIPDVQRSYVKIWRRDYYGVWEVVDRALNQKNARRRIKHLRADAASPS